MERPDTCNLPVTISAGMSPVEDLRRILAKGSRRLCRKNHLAVMERSGVSTIVDGDALEDLIGVAADAGPRELLAAATRAITKLLGERGSCILLDGQPRVALALHEPTLQDLPVDLERYPEIRAAAFRREVVAAEDARHDPLLAPVRDRLPPGLAAVAAVPLCVGQRCLGVVLVQSSRAHVPNGEARATAALMGRLTALLLARGAGEATGAVVAEAAEAPSAPVVIDPRSLEGSRILIVEDDPTLAKALADTLREEGYRVESASDGPAGLRHAREEVPDLVLLDVKLPGFDGFDTAARLRRATATRGVPILFLSGADDLPARVRDIRLEQVDFMPKPFSLDELLARIQQALGQGRARQTLQLAAEHDELTGLGNLRLLRRRMSSERARFARYGHPLSIAMIDVDKLKAINDERGHVAGSNALRGIAGVLRRQARDTDLVVRYGGDEFVVLLPHTGLADARVFGKRVLFEVAALRPEGATVTVSVGIAALTVPSSLESSEELLRRADRAAYRAKEAGGNRVSVDEDALG
jgi:diguanylate cyclase (GGDEF)-like protein